MGSNDREARSPTCQHCREKGSTKELPEKIQITFTVCLRYCLEHTYMKNYSSFAENSNLMGPPGFLLAVFGNCAPRPHGSQTLEGEEKAINPLCVCRVLGVFQTSIYCLLSGFYRMPERNRAGTFILINHAKEPKLRPWSDRHCGQRPQQRTEMAAKAQHPRCCPNNIQASIPP